MAIILLGLLYYNFCTNDFWEVAVNVRDCRRNDANHSQIFRDCQIIVPLWQENQKDFNNIFGVNPVQMRY